ncbi:MAG: 50S ribosomal protein L11 methyltransferase [Bacteroidales bacterium]|nr:50S ribosomal protein L11 methyltransferase [Bacteroidales bacterium]
MPEYARALKEGGRLLLSGFLEEDVQPIVSSATACGLSLVNTASREGWFCLAFVRDWSQGTISQRLCHR